MKTLVKQEESKNGTFRVSVYYDECAESPCTDWDLGAFYLFEYNDNYCHNLHRECNWAEVFGENNYDGQSLNDALVELVKEYVPHKTLVKYVKDGKIDNLRLRYDKSKRMWYLEYYNNWRQIAFGEWLEQYSFTPNELNNFDINAELVEDLDNDVLLDILRNCSKNLYIKEFSCIGYSQGDYVEGVAFCTKEMLEKRSGRNEKTYKTWQEQADAIMEGEIDCINRWMWGDVYGYVLEKKKTFTKVYDDEDEEDEEDFEWEEIDSCWGYFEDPDDIIKEILSDYGEEAA